MDEWTGNANCYKSWENNDSWIVQNISFQDLKDNTEFKYDWSYIVAWIGVGLALIASILFSLAAVCIRTDKEREDAMNMQYLMPVYHQKQQGYAGPYGPYGYAAYPGPYYGSQYGPYNYWCVKCFLVCAEIFYWSESKHLPTATWTNVPIIAQIMKNIFYLFQWKYFPVISTIYYKIIFWTLAFIMFSCPMSTHGPEFSPAKLLHHPS